ncbi:DNA-3-methyladenine glycosylase [Acidicapsa dinghuensis]|uniref:Putative 3-methyladenine DNA glycosylase n=1 Tax=Acidicapsa dinghuensis TaxID=2218256 RepID=A0ABW1EHI8_9BACT|nr:DNA-3-methyladenine glycosylase [Acidicapsa dinghuensis]
MSGRSTHRAPVRLPAGWGHISREFLLPAPEIVAPRLLGKLLARKTTDGWLAGRIVELEAYLGPHITTTPDPAAHSFRGITDRNRVMFGEPGHSYVYFIYGAHFCFNITCEPEGFAGCILVRALEPILGRDLMAANRDISNKNNVSDRDLTSGPGRLCQALDITRPEHNGLNLLSTSSPLQLRDDGFPAPAVEITTRIGIRHAAELPLRFSIAGHPCVSRRTNLRPRRNFAV